MSLFLDNAATSFPKPDAVYRSMDAAMREIGVAPGRGGYQQSLAAARTVHGARSALAQFFGVSDSSRLVFTHSATESLNIATLGLLRPGDHVVSSTMEHNALVRPLALLQKRGVEVTLVPGDREGRVSEAEVARALRPNTRLVALAHCSNVTGTIQPIEEVARIAHQAGVLFLVDAAQTAGYMPLDIEALGIDLLAAPGHKALLGPPGTGILALAPGIELEPLIVGGTGTSASSAEQPRQMPERFESGTINTPALAGLHAGLDFILENGVDRLRQRIKDRVDQLLAGLRETPGCLVYGPAGGERGGVISFNLDGLDPAQVGYILDSEYEICVRVGLHCAPEAHRTIGSYPAGTVRVSPGVFTTETEIDYFLKSLRELRH